MAGVNWGNDKGLSAVGHLKMNLPSQYPLKPDAYAPV
jgi:hypothetical protein